MSATTMFELAFVHGDVKDQRVAYRLVRTTTKHFESGDRTLDIVEWFASRTDVDERIEFLKAQGDTSCLEVAEWHRMACWPTWEPKQEPAHD